MAAELKVFLPLVMDYLKLSLPASEIPPIFAKAFAAGGIPACMDQVFNLTEPFIPQYFLDEQRGLAAGSGIDESTYPHVVQFPNIF